VIELLNEGAEIVVLDNLLHSNKESLNRVEQITGKKVQLYVVDLRDYPGLEVVFKSSGKFDACIHFAGLKAVGESTQIPLEYYDNNLVGSINLFKLMGKYECTNLVFSSSCTVYGLTDKVPLKETEPLTAINPYGWTKYMIEQMLRDLAKGTDGKKWRIVNLRYFNPIGAHESGKIGEDPCGVPLNLVPYVTQVAVGKLPTVSVFGNDYPTKDGTGVRDYIHVVDLARGHVAALTKGIYGTMTKNCDEFNLGTGRGYSVLEVINAVSKASGKNIPYKIVARRPGDSACVYADTTKVEKEWGWKAEFGLERAVADAWRWQSQNPNGFAAPASNTAGASHGKSSS
jgi:UDP-glucose 4-epimerase